MTKIQIEKPTEKQIEMFLHRTRILQALKKEALQKIRESTARRFNESILIDRMACATTRAEFEMYKQEYISSKN
jgi:hypothetical protein